MGGGGGKGGTSTSTVKIPKEVLARYNAVNKRAEGLATRPFQEYGGQFVAGINAQQQAGIEGINNAANAGRGYFDEAGGLMRAGSLSATPGELDINKYLSPYTENVVEATRRGQENQNRQQSEQLAGNAISQGAFGGDRAGIAQANLSGQQSLANQQTLAQLRQQGYTQALGAAQQQQGLGYQAQAANLARQMQAGQGLAGLGAQAQTSALQGAQAQVGAGTLQQQTEQADLSADYNQFLQKQGYDFQIAQFLANIAMGTGALSGSTTTNIQPTSFFSDERLKEDIKPIGKTFDGQPIYSYKMKGDPRTQIGLLAQEVEGRHPEAVGLAKGYKTVDYDKATQGAAHRGHFYRGGLASSAGGGVSYGNAGEGFADGGMPIGGDIQQILAAQKAMFPYQGAGLYGGQPGAGPHGIAIPQQDTAALAKAFQSRISEPPQQQGGGLGSAINTASSLTGLYKGGKEIYNDVSSMDKTPNADYTPEVYDSRAANYNRDRMVAHGGRVGYEMGGSLPYGQGQGSPLEDVLKDQKESAPDAPKAAAPSGGGGQSGFQQALGTGAQIASIASLFAGSDRRMKEGIEPIGKTFDGQVIHKYRYKGDPRTQIGLIAQEVERHHPDAVGLAKGFKTVNYDTATKDAAKRGHFQYGGLAGRSGYGPGGTPTDEEIARARAEGRNIQPSGISGTMDLRDPNAPVAYGPRSTNPATLGSTLPNREAAISAEALAKGQPMPSPMSTATAAAGTAASKVDDRIRGALPPDSPAGRAYDYSTGVVSAYFPMLNDVRNLGTEGMNYLFRSPDAGKAGLDSAFDRLTNSAKGLGQAFGVTGGPSPVSPAAREPAVAASPAPPAVAAAPAGGLAPLAPAATASAAPMTFEQITRARENPNGPIDLVHPGGTAAGVYGINRPTWEGVRSQNPDAGLMSYDELFGANKQDVPGSVQTAQQKLALDLLQQSNGSVLTNSGVPVNNGTLSTAHFLGAPTAVALNQARPDMPIQEFVAGLPVSDATKASMLQQMPGIATVADALARQEKNWMSAGQTATGLAGAARPDATPSVSPTLDTLQRATLGTPQQATLGTPPAAPEAKAPTLDFKEPPPVTEAEFRARAQKELPGQQNWLERNQGWLVPLLSGLGTMASSDSRYLGSAILQGIGGAAVSYPEMQKAQQDILQSNLANQQKFADLAASDFRTIAGRQMVYVAGRQQPIQYGEWLSAGSPPTAHQAQYMQSLGYSPEDIAGMAANKVAAPQTKVDARTAEQIAADNDFMNRATDAQRATEIENSSKFHQDVLDAADTSASMLRNTKYASRIVAGLSEADVGPTALSDIRAMIINNINAVAANIPGLPPDARIDPKAQDLRQELAKMNNQIALANVGASDQKSLAALQTALASNPGKDLSLAANKAILAKLAADQQRDIDEAAYLDYYRKQFPDPSNYMARNAERSFRQIYTDDRYRKETDAIESLLNQDPETYAMLVDGRFSAEEIDNKFFKKLGVSNMSRYFLGGM